MTKGAQVVVDVATKTATEMAPEVRGAVKRLIAQHGKMVAARSALAGLDAEDEGFQEAVDEYDVQRGLWLQSVELEALNVGKELVATLLAIVGTMV